MKREFFWIDAFTDSKFGGNPCAVVFDAEGISDAEMLALAKEFNLSETAFVLKSTQADFGARYFTPAEEIPLAGHPTIATVRALLEAGRLNRDADHQRFKLELPAGIVGIEVVRIDEQKFLITMSQRTPAFLSNHDRKTVAEIFGLTGSDLLPGLPVQTVSTGTPQLMIPVRDHGALKRASIQRSAYLEYKSQSDFFSPHLFCLGGVSPRAATFARHFGVPPDSPEDAFTGSATGGMAAYLWRYRLIDSPRFIAEQGHWLGRPGLAHVEIVGSPDKIETVKVGGEAVVLARGELSL